MRTDHVHPLAAQRRDLRWMFWLSLAGLGAAQLLAWLGATPSVRGLLAATFSPDAESTAFWNFAMLGAGVLHAAISPRRASRWLPWVAGAALTVVALVLRPADTQVLNVLANAVGGLAIGLAGLDAARSRSWLPLSVGLLPIFCLLSTQFLMLTVTLRPKALDPYLWFFDQTLGLRWSVDLGTAFASHRGLRLLSQSAYLALPLALALAVVGEIRRGTEARGSVFRLFVLSTLIGFTLYFAFPALGPRPYFGKAFPTQLPALTDGLPQAGYPEQFGAPRNAMPSLHFAWALLLAVRAWRGRWLERASYLAFCGLTLLATLGMGHHYAIDLFAALPLVILTLTLADRSLAPALRLRLAFESGGLLFASLLASFLLPRLPAFGPLAAWALVLSLVGHFAISLRRLATGATAGRASEARPASVSSLDSRTVRVGLMFFLSGAAALGYEVVFSKGLALAFGSTALAMYTVLMTYMGGMALGAWWGGRLAERTRSPLRTYAYLELAIAAWCIASPITRPLFRSLYALLASGLEPDSAWITVLRLAVGGAVLLPVTFLMGATLPVMAKALQSRFSLGQATATLYTANTAGAALGAVLTAYAVVPSLGVTRTTLAAALLSILAGWLALGMAKRESDSSRSPTSAPSQESRGIQTTEVRFGRAAFFLVTSCGLVTLALEVVYIHLLAVVAGNSVYAFGLMLFAFLSGLALGAAATRRLLRTSIRPSAAFAAWGFALTAAILGGVFLWDSLPGYFAQFSIVRDRMGFGLREFVRAQVCFAVMLPPAVCLGAMFPLAVEAIGRLGPEHRLARLGRAAALNTLGNILGVAVAAFLLLPGPGSLRGLWLLAGVAGVTALVAAGTQFATYDSRERRLLLAGLLVALGLAVAQPADFDQTALASGANVYFKADAYGEVIDHAESADGGLTSVARVSRPGSDQPVLTLLTNGKFQGDNGHDREMAAQYGFALAPLLHTTGRERALVIGYGTGVSAGAIHRAGFSHLDLVELSGDVFELANRHFADVNGRPDLAAGTESFVTDGRNFLLLQDRQYDLISLEISSIWFAGAASLYNREFYALAKNRLRPGGVLQQWLQLHRLDPLDIGYVLGSARAEFRYVWLYKIGPQGVIIASDTPLASRPETIALLNGAQALEPVRGFFGGDFGRLTRTLLLDPAATDRVLDALGGAETLISTDDNLFLEYHTPRGNVRDYGLSIRANLEFLSQFRQTEAPAR